MTDDRDGDVRATTGPTGSKETMTNEKRTAANRANAKRSTGPRTAEGKARSARNAERHGVYSSLATVLTGAFAEDPERVQGLLEGIREDLLPRSFLEEHACRRIASAILKQQRLERFTACRISSAGKVSPTIAALSPEMSVEELAAEQLFRGDLEQMVRLDAHVGKELDGALVSFRDARIICECIWMGQLEVRYAKRTQRDDLTKKRIRLSQEFPD